MVLANGERVTASADEHPDLYWAIRGGGGNFGVVTSFLFRLHPVDVVVGGPTFWPVEQAAELLSVYREFLPQAPRELNGRGRCVPPGPALPSGPTGPPVALQQCDRDSRSSRTSDCERGDGLWPTTRLQRRDGYEPWFAALGRLGDEAIEPGKEGGQSLAGARWRRPARSRRA
jgi:hypothetical protein